MIVEELAARLGLDIDEVAFEKGEAALHGLRHGLIAFGTAAIAGLAVGAAAIAKTTADAADGAKKLAQSTGLDLQQLQEISYAADLAHVSHEEMAVGLQHLAKTGVKNLREEVLKLSDQFAKMPDDGRKVQIAMEKFGRSGARLIPLLNGGREKMSALFDEAHDLGVVFSKEDADASEEFNENLERLEKSLLGIRNSIGIKLLGPLSKAAEKMREFFVALRHYRPDMERVVMWAKGLAFVLGGVLLTAILANIGAIATAVSWYAALGVAAVISAAQAVAAWIAAAAPFVIIAAGIAFVLAILEDLYQFLTGGESVIGDFVDYVKEEFGGWRGFFKALWDWIVHIFDEGTKAAMDLVGDLLDKVPGGNILAAVGRGVLGNQTDTLSSLGDLFFGGGAASPQASAAAAVNAKTPTVNAPQFKADITVNAAPGQSAQEVANAVTTANDEWWGRKMSAAEAGAGD